MSLAATSMGGRRTSPARSMCKSRNTGVSPGRANGSGMRSRSGSTTARVTVHAFLRLLTIVAGYPSADTPDFIRLHRE